VRVPSRFPGASTVSPTFTVYEGQQEIDSFKVTVEYPKPFTRKKQDEDLDVLVRIISELAFRVPQLPFVANLFKS
jgi:hypothetical protein